FGPAGTGNDAVRTELVAADLNANVRLEGRRPHRGVAGRVVADEARLDLMTAGIAAAETDRQLGFARRLHLLHERWHFGQLTGTDDHIDIRRALANRVLILLGHAAENADNDTGIVALQQTHATERGVSFVLGVFADRTGVEEENVGVRGRVSQVVAVLAERAD